LPRGRKAGYGAAEIGITSIEFFLQFYVLKFYTDVVGLAPGMAGLALGLAMAWDAIAEPLMGTISDHTRTRWGKRLPYVVGGAPLLAASFMLLFSPPHLDTQAEKFWFLLLFYILVNTGMTIVAVPHAAFGGELSSDLDERTEIFGWRFLFTNVGLVLGILIPGLVAATAGAGDSAADATATAGTASAYIAVILCASCLVTFLSTRRLDSPSTQAAVSLRSHVRSLATTFANRPFLILLATYVLGSVGRMINSAVALFYYEYRLGLAQSDVFFYVLLPFGCLIAGSIVLWLFLSRRFGKRLPAFWGIFLLGLLTSVVYPVLPRGQLLPPILVAIVGGVLVGALFLIESTVADVVDYDEVKTGLHREGLYFGLWRMGTKLSRAVGLALSGRMLGVIGHQSGAPVQHPDTELGLALIFGPGVGAFLMLAAFVFLCMPLDRARMQRIRRILELRQARRQARRDAPAARASGPVGPR
jgi:GPH family glycoside/pentoside/hexuronide:cation symporter